jgi:hypothetical protein
MVSSAPKGCECDLQLRTQRFAHGRPERLRVAAADPLAEGLRQSSRRTDQRRPCAHQRISGSDHRKIRLCLSTAMLNRRQQLRIDPGQPGQGLRVQPVVLSPLSPIRRTLRACATIASCPSSGRRRLTHGECVPVSSAMRLRGIFPKIFFIASGLVLTLSSRMTSPDPLRTQ